MENAMEQPGDSDFPYPILEFDPEQEAIIEPARCVRPVEDPPEHLVICFFKEVVEKVVTEHQARIIFRNSWEDGPHHIYETEYKGKRLAFLHSSVGAPAATGLLEEAFACGFRKFIVCGGCGVLQKDIAVGNLIVISSAVRDEGTSYHYLPPGREIGANEVGIRALEAALKEQGVSYRLGKTWTTDAPYRETRRKAADRRAEGCIVVEMESASLMA
ncbi:MAG: phosphorylase, partial [Chloroflexi bacterium]